MKLQDKIAQLESEILHRRVRLDALVFSEKKNVKRSRALFAILVPGLIIGLSLIRSRSLFGLAASSGARLLFRMGSSGFSA